MEAQFVPPLPVKNHQTVAANHPQTVYNSDTPSSHHPAPIKVCPLTPHKLAPSLRITLSHRETNNRIYQYMYIYNQVITARVRAASTYLQSAKLVTVINNKRRKSKHMAFLCACINTDNRHHDWKAKRSDFDAAVGVSGPGTFRRRRRLTSS